MGKEYEGVRWVLEGSREEGEGGTSGAKGRQTAYLSVSASCISCCRLRSA